MMMRRRSRRTALTGAHHRFRQRATAVRRRPWRTAIALAVVLSLVGAVVFVVGFSSAFVAREVVVTGVSGGQAREVRAAAAIPSGRPLARVDTAQVQQRVLSADVRIRRVDVGRAWPSTITVDVVLRGPAIAVAQPRRELQVADGDGVVYGTLSATPKGLPKITTPEGDVDPALLKGALAMHGSLSEPVRAKAEKMQLDERGSLSFGYGDIAVIWGSADESALKSRVLDALVNQGAVRSAEGPVTIDLSVPGTPVVTGLAVEDES